MLSTDVQELQSMVIAQGTKIAKQDSRIAQLEQLIKYYEEQHRLSMHKRFGSSSEKKPVENQLHLGVFDEVENTADLTMAEPLFEEIAYKRRKKIGKREDDLSGFETIIEEHRLTAEECYCRECGNPLHEMGSDIARRELEIIPAQVKVRVHKRIAYACRECEKKNDHVPIVKAPIPEPLIKGSLASPSAVAHIMTQKYVMHAPLYRQEQDWKRQEVNLSRQTLANWVIRCAEDWLVAIYNRLHSHLLEQSVLFADETRVQVLKEPGKSATSQSFMWVYRTGNETDKQAILYQYQPSRAYIHPQRFLSGWSGLLHADGYAGYHRLSSEITVVGCWNHARTKFHDALKAIPTEERASSVAGQAVNQISYLFHLDKNWKNLAPEERHRRRLEESKPLAEAFFTWCEKQTVLPQSTTGRAIRYALEQKPWLMNVYIDGRTDFSTNRIENCIRPFALSRKNFLFCNTVKGAEASAIVFSIIETAKANSLKPFEYLEFLLKILPNSTSSAIDTLLPWGKAVPSSCMMGVLEM